MVEFWRRSLLALATSTRKVLGARWENVRDLRLTIGDPYKTQSFRLITIWTYDKNDAILQFLPWLRVQGQVQTILHQRAFTMVTLSVLDVLAPELLHEIISFLPLCSLLVVRSICRTFQDIVLYSTRISKSRASLLKLFISIVNSPAFIQTRPWTLANVAHFNRAAYLNYLEGRTCSHSGGSRVVLPPEFKTWVLEWPGRASFGSCWPGLPAHDYAGLSVVDGIQRLEGKNWLGSQPPQVSALVWRNETPEVGWAPGILVWKKDREATWLVCRCNCESRDCDRCGQQDRSIDEQDLAGSAQFNQWFGKVVVTPKRLLGYNQLEPASTFRPEVIFHSWTTYLGEIWRKIECTIKDRVEPLEVCVDIYSSNWSTGAYPNLGMFYDPERLNIPAPSWNERNMPEHQGNLFNS